MKHHWRLDRQKIKTWILLGFASLLIGCVVGALDTLFGRVLLSLSDFRSEHFTLEETLDFILTFIIETEELLKSKFISWTYTEEFGYYKGLSQKRSG